MRWWGGSGTAVHWDGSGSAQELELMLSPLPWGALRDANVMRALARLVGVGAGASIGAGARTGAIAAAARRAACARFDAAHRAAAEGAG